MNKVLLEDIESFTLPEDLIDPLRGSTILVTGATGLIGSMFVKCLNALHIDIRFVLPVRNIKKALNIFQEIQDGSIFLREIAPGEICNCDIHCDYIVNCASPTNGTYMEEHPVETFSIAVEYTKELLEYCRKQPVKGMVYLSSIEYYGQIFNDDPVSEGMMGHIDRSSARNSYALGKQAAEFLIFAYAREYGVPSKTARLTQTFGAGISPEDKRVFAQFASSVVAGEEIVLHTEGQSAKPYCYLTDCISALVYILIKGNNGEAYNVATPSTYVTIRELAETFASFSDSKSIRHDLSSDHSYAPETRINMDSSKLLALGWRPRYGLKDMVGRLLDYLRETQEDM